jgi:hypothetical protein
MASVKNEATYLLADVEKSAEFKLYTINRQKLENYCILSLRLRA